MGNNHWSASQQLHSLVLQRNPNPSPLQSVASCTKSRSPHQKQRKSAWHSDRALRKSTLPHMTWPGQPEQCRNLGSQLERDIRAMRLSPLAPNRAGLLGSPLVLHGYIRWLGSWWSKCNCNDSTTASWSCWRGMTSQALSATDRACLYHIPPSHMHTHPQACLVKAQNLPQRCLVAMPTMWLKELTMSNLSSKWREVWPS